MEDVGDGAGCVSLGAWEAGQQAEEPLGLAVLGRAPLCFGEGTLWSTSKWPGKGRRGSRHYLFSPCAGLWALGEMAKVSYSSLEEPPWSYTYHS